MALLGGLFSSKFAHCIKITHLVGMSCDRSNNGPIRDLRSVDKATIRLSKLVGISQECAEWMYDISKPSLRLFFVVFLMETYQKQGLYKRLASFCQPSQTHYQRTCFCDYYMETNRHLLDLQTEIWIVQSKEKMNLCLGWNVPTS